MTYDYDLFVIGAGSGGVRAARMSAGFGARVAIAEDRYLGGTCVNVGCVPKKLFVYAAHFSHDLHNAAGFGWRAENHEFDWSALIRNKNREIERLNGVYGRLLDNAGVLQVNGRASLVDPHTVSVGKQCYTAERILIATGGWPLVPDIPGKEHAITSNEAFYLDELPASILIVGGGYIAVEFAGIFNGLGVDTTLVYRRDLFLRGFDSECRALLAEEIAGKGIKLVFNTNIKIIEKTGHQYTCITDREDKYHAGLVMFATGRSPNTTGLGIEKLGLDVSESGAISINDDYQSSIPSIYAIGDVTDRYNLTPVATAEGTSLASRLFGNGSANVDYTGIPTCVFSQPEFGTVGLTEESAREKFSNINIYKTRFRPLKLSLADDAEKTFMKMIVDADTDRVIGVHVIGSDAGEIIQGVAVAMKAGAAKSDFDATIGIHPTSAEELVTLRTPA